MLQATFQKLTAGFQLKRFENQLCFISVEGPMRSGEGGADPNGGVPSQGEPVGDNSPSD